MKQFSFLLFYCFLFTTAFCQWNSNTAVNLEAAGINAGPISTASTSDGKTFIAFYSQVSSSSFDMRVQLLDRNGNRLFGANGIVANNYSTGSSTYVYNTCIGPENSFIVACQDQRNGSNGTVLIKVNGDGSLPWGIGGVYLGTGLAPYPAVLSNGDIIAAWSDNSNKVSYQKISANGTVAWATPKQVQLTVGSTVYGSTQAQPVAQSNGSFTMVMQRRVSFSSSFLYAQRYNNNGDSLWSSYVQLATGSTAPSRSYSIATDADTIYYGYYSSVGTRFNSFVQRINPDGTLPWGINGAPFSTYSGTQPYNQTTNIAHTTGSPYVWSVCSYSNSAQSQYGVYIQKFDAITGARLFNVDGKEVYPISAALDQQIGTLALINDAPLFMSYDANYKIYATRLNASGDFVWTGNRVELSSTTAGGSTPKGRFNFTPASNDQAVAVWNENRSTDYRVYAQNITAAGATGPLPVKLERFTAIKKGSQTDLSWTTATEANNKGFYVQSSTDGSHFTNLQFVATKAINGNSNLPLEYILTDFSPAKGANYYRLQQIDKDGKTTFSQVLLVRFDAIGMYVQSLYPNPVANSLNFTIASPVNTAATLTILNINGQRLIQEKVSLQAGATTLKLPVALLPGGNYWLQIRTNNETLTEKWTKQ